MRRFWGSYLGGLDWIGLDWIGEMQKAFLRTTRHAMVELGIYLYQCRVE